MKTSPAPKGAVATSTASSANGSPDLPGPRHATLWATLAYVIATLVLAYPALAGRFLINTWSDQYIAGYAFRDFAAQSLRAGHGFPLWDAYLYGGMPYVAAMHGDIFYPTFLLRMVMPTDLAMTWEFPIHLFLCGLFTFLFLRAWRFGFYGSLIGGLAYMLGGSIAGYASPGHDGKLFVSALMPALLLLITRGVRDGRLWAWGGVAFLTGLSALSPQPQLFQYSLLVSGVFTLYVAFAEHPAYGQLARATALRRIGLALGAVVLGLAISAVQYMPLFEYKPWSPRASGYDFGTTRAFSFPIEETLNAYWPQFSGILNAYWGRNGIHFHSDYFGVVVLILFGAAFGQFRQRGFRRFWLATGAVALLWAYGGNTPFFKIPLALVPGTKYFRAPSTIIFVTAFAVAVCAAIGVERILARRVGKKYILGWSIAGVVFAILMSIGGYTALASGVVNSIASGYPPEAHSQVLDHFMPGATENTSAAIVGVWRSCLFVLLTAGALWLLLQQRISLRAAAIALAVLLVVDLWSIERDYWVFSSRASVIYATNPAIEAIKADIAKNGPARVWTTDAFGGSMPPHNDAFFYDALMSHGVRVAIGYHGNELDRYDQVLAHGDISGGGQRPVLSPEFFRHQNVRYVYTDAPDSLMQKVGQAMKLSGPLTLLAGPVPDAAGAVVFAYKLPGDNPFAWVASAIVKAPDMQSLNTVLDARYAPRSFAIADTGDTHVQSAQLATMPPEATTQITVNSYAPGAFDLSIDQPATAGQALVVSENYFPGWAATVDGHAVPVSRMNYNLMGLALPAGARQVQFRFDDPAYERGKRVTLAALLLGLIVLAGGIIADRRGRDASATPIASAPGAPQPVPS